MADKYTKLIKKIKADVKTLEGLNGDVKKLTRAFKKDPKSARGLDAAREALKKKVEDLYPRYFALKAAFKNTTAVVKHLKDHGYKVSKSTVHNAVNAGILPQQEDGKIYEEDVRLYAATLKKIKGEPDQIAEKTQEELQGKIDLRKVQTEKEQLLLNKALGKLIDRAEFYQELAARAAALDVGIDHYIQTMVTELILLCRGDEKKAPQVMEKMQEQRKILMNEYVATDKFHVTFIESSEEDSVSGQ